MILNLAGLLIGVLFSLGLGLSGMTDPEKILEFLDVKGNWDPSLIFVMASAIPVYALFYRIIMRSRRPLLENKWYVPARADIDVKLITGAGIFGIGWGMSGICPGPGIAAIGALSKGAAVFVACYVIGFSAEAAYDKTIGAWFGASKLK